MVIDCHVHISATTPGRGKMSEHLLGTFPFRFLQWKFGLTGAGERDEAALRKRLLDALHDATELDAAVVLAFDAVYDGAGRRDEANTHLYVANAYVCELAAEDPKVLFGCSVHPYRDDAVEELERCVDGGAVLCKWLPITQGIDPAHPKCLPFYEALAHHGLPLLSHTGGELTLPNVNKLADPALLRPALERGVTVIAAHCGTRSAVWETDHLPTFVRMTRDYDQFYGDTSALNWVMRSYAWRTVLDDAHVRSRLVHGSDWPILPLPPVPLMSLDDAWATLRVKNWLSRDVAIKRKLGLDDAYLHRAAKVLRMGTMVERT